MSFWDEIEHFTEDEFRCPCCGRAPMDEAFIRMLDDHRNRSGFPFPINSGYRCPDYNAKISSTGRTGPHTTGKAADVGVFGRNAHRFLQQAVLGGWYSGVGIRQHGAHNSRFIHVDTLTTEENRFRPTIWTYK